MVKVAVLGGGSFGTALAYHNKKIYIYIAKNGHGVRLLSRRTDVCHSINTFHKHTTCFQDAILPPNIIASTDPKEVLSDCKFIIHCVPVQQSANYLSEIIDFIPPDVPIISSSKGIETNHLLYMSDLIPKVLKRDQPTAFFSGPSFAKEIIQNMPTAVVIASKDLEIANKAKELFVSPTFRVYLSEDVIGVEVGGALKNIFALAAGAAAGLGLGMNTLALIVTRGCHEMTKLAETMGAQPDTLSGLSGIGDLMLTCFSPLSRNRTVGFRIGQGEKLADIEASMDEVAEGVPTAFAAVRLMEKYNLHLPIISTVPKVLNGELSAQDAMHFLMTLPAHTEKGSLANGLRRSF